MKLIIYPGVDIWDFVLSGLRNRSDVLLFPLNRNSNFFQKVSRKLGNGFSLPPSFIIGTELRNSLQSLSVGDAVILAEYTDLSLVSAIDNVVPDYVSRYIWLWNHKGNDETFLNNLPIIKDKKFQVITYEESDAERFGFRWHTQFFNIRPYREKLFNESISYDFLFVGYSKNRVEEIENIRSLLSSYICKFVIVNNSSEYISYSKYMEMALHSRCIVEIVHSGDASCTLRPLEAMALRRKLLTNNPAVRKYSFYCPQNIFILGEDNIEDLSVFLERPFYDLPSEIVNSYDVNVWINQFL